MNKDPDSGAVMLDCEPNYWIRVAEQAEMIKLSNCIPVTGMLVEGNSFFEEGPLIEGFAFIVPRDSPAIGKIIGFAQSSHECLNLAWCTSAQMPWKKTSGDQYKDPFVDAAAAVMAGDTCYVGLPPSPSGKPHVSDTGLSEEMRRLIDVFGINPGDLMPKKFCTYQTKDAVPQWMCQSGQTIRSLVLRKHLCGATLAGVRRFQHMPPFDDVFVWPGADFKFHLGDKLVFLKEVLEESIDLRDESFHVGEENYAIGWRRLWDEQSKCVSL